MPETITPYLLYEDCAGALDWLSKAFGFSERLRFTNDEGNVNHAEMELGGGSIMMGGPGGEYRNPKQAGVTVGIHVYVDDVDSHFERAREAGAKILAEPEDQEYGDRRYSAEDPEGHHWYFAQRIRELAPEDWGATTSGAPAA